MSQVRNVEQMRKILIAYTSSELNKYICLSGFLRLCGFIVGDGRIEDINRNIGFKTKGFDLIVVFSRDVISQNDTVTDIINLIIDETLKNNKCLCEVIIQRFLEIVKEHNFIREDLIHYLYKIADVYKKYDLYLHEYNSQHYNYNNDFASKVCDAFYYCERELMEIAREAFQKDDDSLCSLQYARCYCVRRVLEMKSINKLEKNFYDVEKVVKLLKIIKQEWPEVISVNLLIGYILETYSENHEIILEYYKEFLEKTGEICFNSTTYYRIGKIYEKCGKPEDARTNYKKALELDPDNYRAEYKVIDYEGFRESKYELAIERYKGLIQRFEKLKKDGVLQPLELEYLFKIYFRCGRIYLKKLPDMMLATKYFSLEEKLADIKISDMGFLCQFYGEDAIKYLDSTLKRFPMYQIWINKQEAEWNICDVMN